MRFYYRAAYESVAIQTKKFQKSFIISESEVIQESAFSHLSSFTEHNQESSLINRIILHRLAHLEKMDCITLHADKYFKLQTNFDYHTYPLIQSIEKHN